MHQSKTRIEKTILPLVIALCFGMSAMAKVPADTIRTNVPNRAYYKDLYLDCSISITSKKTLPAADLLGISMEKLAFNEMEDSARQNRVLVGNKDDVNGVLLYPDGQPRFKVLFINGGSSIIHGRSLGSRGRANIRQFYNNGGSYVGCCAGAILASQGYGNSDIGVYFKIFPRRLQHTNFAKVDMGLIVDPDSKLLKYYDFGGDNYVANVRHNVGNYPDDLPKGTEVLGRFDFPKGAKFHHLPMIYAYKTSNKTGRMVLCGSHPEEPVDGERRDVCAAMIQYASEGVGMTQLKGFLENGKTREMVKTTQQHDPAYTRIGDLQCHHFAVRVPENARDISFKLSSTVDISNLKLAICNDTYAYEDVADYTADAKGARQEMCFSSLTPGIWYVTVKCMDKPVVRSTGYGDFYESSPIDLLNGIPYSIEASWNN
ncbi:MAG: hypothetical protein Q4E60_06160 [Bacteroidales bacterium]|nr:hypothetical protein [Bacteroidales bacterium]